MLGGTQKQITIGNYRKQDKKRTKTKHKRKKKSKFSRKRDGRGGGDWKKIYRNITILYKKGKLSSTLDSC